MRYHNLDIWIGRRPEGGFALSARCIDHGETDVAATADVASLRRDLTRLEEGSADRSFVVRFGSMLYDHVFATDEGRVGLHFGRCTELARVTTSDGVRLRLRVEDPEIATVPWEYLYSPIRSDFLGASTATPIVRYLELPEPPRPLAASLPLHMLVVIPEDSELDTETEKRDLLDALGDLQASQQVRLHFLDGRVTRERLSDTLLAGRFDIFHFIGHGDFQDEQAYLVLNRGEGGDDFVDHDWMARLFANHPSMKLVVLNACKSARVSSARPLVGMAPQLVRREIPAVVAMQFEIADEEALCFARTFYRSLFDGADRGRVDVAVSHARNELLKEYPDSGAMGAPILFMRGAEGVLFSLEAAGLRDLPFERGSLDTAHAVVRTHEERIASARRQNDEPLAESESRQLHRARRRIRLRNASLASAFGVALLAFFGLWMYAFDWLPWPLKPEYYTIAIGDAISGGTLHEAVAIVSINEAGERELGRPFDASWRAEHARLVRNLSQAGAAVVAFDLIFPLPTVHDSAFAAAVDDAAEAGTRVVLGANAWNSDGRPALADQLHESAARWGSLCVGLARHAPNVVPLLSISNHGTPAPSLALVSVAAFDRAVRFDLDRQNRQINLYDERHTATRRITVADIDISGRRPGDCTIIRRDDPYAELIIRYTPLAQLHSQRFAYEHVVLTDQPDTLSRQFEGKIVLVGVETGREDLRTVPRGLRTESRYGLMLHVDAVNAILQNVTIRWLGGWWQFTIIVCMAAAGAALAHRSNTTRRLDRNGYMVAIPLLYAAVTVYLYLVHHLLLNGIYHLLAFFLAYWMVRKIKLRFFP